jgi:cysteine-rich repeat protein
VQECVAVAPECVAVAPECVALGRSASRLRGARRAAVRGGLGYGGKMHRLGWVAAALIGAGCFVDNKGGASGAEDDASTAMATTTTPTTGMAEASAPGEGTTDDATGGAVCGDFTVEGAEECDNGAANNGGGGLCREDCRLNTCGDEYLAAAVEGCDDGNTVDGDGCSATCTSESCGDGVKDGAEECDDGNQVDSDQCTNLCRLPFCGDGVTSGVEECDDGEDNSDEGACTPNCQAAVCGDGLVQAGVEQCDDGNSVDDDGCDNFCSAGGAVCGNGFVEAGEACDDGNTMDDDGCAGDCQAVSPTCGDGVVSSEEECDDGNGVEGDACSGTCMRTGFWVFVSSMKFTGGFGSFGVADAACTAMAQGLPIAGNYRAWLGDSNTPIAARLDNTALRYLRVDGVVVADGWADLTDGTLDAPIDRTESGTALAADPASCVAMEFVDVRVWTGLASNGAHVGNCQNWTTGAAFDKAQIGLANHADDLWTAACTSSCDQMLRIYCIEQP